jgi:hypothetical protein
MTNPRNTPPPLGPITGVLSENKVIRRESADNYSWVLIEFFADCRLILCKHGKQWIVQFRSARKPNKGVWVGRKHITSKAALLVICSALNLVRDASVAQKVLALPDNLTGGSQNG